MDAAFRKILSDTDIIYELIKLFIPQLISIHNISKDDIHIEKTEFLSSDLKVKRVDVLVRISKNDYEAFLFVLIEHQSSKDFNMPFRLLDYMTRIWGSYIQDKKDEAKNKVFKYPQIIPIVLYTGKGNWTVERDIKEKIRYAKGLEEYVPSFKYLVIELSQIEKEWLLRVKGILSKLLYTLKINGKEEEAIKELEDLIEAIKELKGREVEKFFDMMKVLLIGEGVSVEKVEEIVEELRKGEVKGMIWAFEEARTAGAIEAKIEDILNIIEVRFGNVQEDIKEKVEEIKDLEKLDELFKSSLKVKSLEEFRSLL